MNVSGRSGVSERSGRKGSGRGRKRKKEGHKEMKWLEKWRELFHGLSVKKAGKHREGKVSEKKRKQPKVR